MECITKKEFAKRMGVTTVTVFNWIKSNKNGIRKYNTQNGIRTDIFDDPTWMNQDRTQDTTIREAQAQQELEIVKAELAQMSSMYDALAAERDEARHQAELNRVRADELEKRVADLIRENERIAGELDQEKIAGQELRQLMHQQQALTAQQLKLNAPRPLLASLFPRWYERTHPANDESSTPSGSNQ